MANKNILVVGSFTTDFNIRVPHFPQPGETIAGSEFSTNPGGKGANQAYGAAKLGGNVKMVGCVGDDHFGKVIFENMRSVGVDMSGVRAVEGVATGVAMIDIDNKGQNAISLAPNANYALTYDMVLETWEEIEDEVDLIVMQLENPIDVIKQTAKLGKESGKMVILNPAPAQPLDDEFLSYVDILIPNETETNIITRLPVESNEECIVAAKVLQKRGVEQIILTLGSRGSLVVDRNGNAVFVDPYKIVPVDTTGAGDAFIAGFAVALAQGMSLVEAAGIGNAAGALNATKLGAQGGLPTKEEMDRFLAGQK